MEINPEPPVGKFRCGVMSQPLDLLRYNPTANKFKKKNLTFIIKKEKDQFAF